MKKLLIIIAIITLPLLLKAQETPFGTQRDSVRKSYENSLMTIAKSVRSNTCDTVKWVNGWQSIFYYQEDKLSRIKFIFPLNYADAMRMSINRQSKSVKDDLWIDKEKGEKTQLIEDKEKNQCIVDLSPIDKKER